MSSWALLPGAAPGPPQGALVLEHPRQGPVRHLPRVVPDQPAVDEEPHLAGRPLRGHGVPLRPVVGPREVALLATPARMMESGEVVRPLALGMVHLAAAPVVEPGGLVSRSERGDLDAGAVLSVPHLHDGSRYHRGGVHGTSVRGSPHPDEHPSVAVLRRTHAHGVLRVVDADDLPAPFSGRVGPARRIGPPVVAVRAGQAPAVRGGRVDLVRAVVERPQRHPVTVEVLREDLPERPAVAAR